MRKGENIANYLIPGIAGVALFIAAFQKASLIWQILLLAVVVISLLSIGYARYKKKRR